jgi:hypothetical protein
MPRKTIRIEPMNEPLNVQPNEQQSKEPPPEMTDEVLATIVEEVKNDVLPVSKPKRTRRTKAKQEEEQQVINVEPEPVNETAPTVPVVEPAPIVTILDESDVVSTRTDRPDKITCNACGKVLSMKSFKYSHQKTCSGLTGTKSQKERSQARKLTSSPIRKSEIKFDDEAPEMVPLRRHPSPPHRILEVRTHPDHNTVVEPRIHRANMRKERMVRLFSSAV